MKVKPFIFILLGLLCIFLQGCFEEEDSIEEFQSYYMADFHSSELCGSLSNGLINIDLVPLTKRLMVEETSILSIKVTSKGEPITDANVLFEMWKEGEDYTVKVEAIPEEHGIYTLAGKFYEKGEYNLVAHVDALNLHEMQIFRFSIQEKKNNL